MYRSKPETRGLYARYFDGLPAAAAITPLEHAAVAGAVDKVVHAIRHTPGLQAGRQPAAARAAVAAVTVGPCTGGRPYVCDAARPALWHRLFGNCWLVSSGGSARQRITHA